MNYTEANRIAEDILDRVAPTCVRSSIAGSVRRREPEVHDIELVLEPKQGHIRPSFGEKQTHAHWLDKALYELQQEGRLRRVMGGPNMHKYAINLDMYDYPYDTLNPFHLETYIMTPPRQFGVGLTIRTGPGRESDNFSKYCVMNRTGHDGEPTGGWLPDGYKVRYLAVWKLEQGSYKGGLFEPNSGETPLPMPDEKDFFDFLGLPFVEPWLRHAPHGGRYG